MRLHGDASLAVVITGAAFCPHPPLLVPQVAQGAAGEVEDLRAACRTAIQRVAGRDERLVVIGTAAQSDRYPAGSHGSLAGYGVDVAVSLGHGQSGRDGLPLALAVGAWLLRDALGESYQASGVAVTGEEPLELGPEPTALLVMGDGSARRSLAAPGYLDERAEAYDARVAAALRAGRPADLTPDPAIGAELLAAGVPAWRTAARTLGQAVYDAEVLYDAAPYGVGYFVAAWTARG